MKSKILTTTILIVLTTATIFAQTGREIAEKAKNRPDGDTRQSELTMKLINKRGKIRERKLLSYSMDIGKDEKSIMFFTYPGDVKGTGFLTWDYDKIGKDDDKWLYLPAMKKTRRISGSSAKKDYFMGSDFTYDDMGDRNIDEDTHKLLGEETIDGIKCWKLESVSKDKRDIFSKKIAWIRQDNYMAVKIDYYDRMGKLHRQMQTFDIKEIDGFWTMGKMEMINVQTNHKTVLEFKNQKFNMPLTESKFTVKTLEKGRM